MTTMAEQVRPRGRPRGNGGAFEREAKVLALLEQRRAEYPSLHELWDTGDYDPGPEPYPGLTRNELAAVLGESTSLVYLALTRLRVDGKVRTCSGKGSTTVWATCDGGCP